MRMRTMPLWVAQIQKQQITMKQQIPTMVSVYSLVVLISTWTIGGRKLIKMMEDAH